MSKPILCVPSNNQPEAHPSDQRSADLRLAGMEMARVLRTAPLRIASDPSNGAIAHWKHGPLHDVVEPMTDHVIMTYTAGDQRARATLRKICCDWNGAFRGRDDHSGWFKLPMGYSRPLNVVQLYLPHATLERIAGEADMAAPVDLLERTGHPDPITSRLLVSAADVLEGNEALDALFRQQLTDLLATRLLAAHAGAPITLQPVMGGLSPKALRRAIERLRSDSDADVSLAALASDAGLSRFHFCRAFKESTGLSPHAWLRQHRLEQAMNMLRDTDDGGRVGRSGARLCLPNRLRRSVPEADRRNPERLAEAHALTAIALQVRQSLVAQSQVWSATSRSSRC